MGDVEEWGDIGSIAGGQERDRKELVGKSTKPKSEGNARLLLPWETPAGRESVRRRLDAMLDR
jgi:hypothetical protein